MILTELRILKDIQENDLIRHDYILYYSIKGISDITLEGKKVQLKKDDIISINPEERYSVDTTNSILIEIKINCKKLMQLIGYQQKYIICNTCDNKNENSINLAKTINHLAKAAFDPVSDRILYEQYSLQLVFQLITNYSVDRISSEEDERKNAIRNYLYAHYAEELSLQDVADEFGFTPQYFSKYFHDAFGTTFLKFLNQIRVTYAAQELLENDEVILKVAINNGFSNAASFIREFKIAYGMSPSEYRQINRIETKTNNIDFSEMKMYLDESEEDNGSETIGIDIDAETTFPILDRYWSKIVNLGSFRTIIKNNVFSQVEILRNQLDYKTARLVVDVLSDKHGNYYVADQVMNFFVEHRMDVILVLDYREAVSSENYLKNLNDFCLHYSRRFGDGIFHHTTFELAYDSEYKEQSLKDYKDFYIDVKKVLNRCGYDSDVIGPAVLLDNTGDNLRRFVKTNRQIRTYTICVAPYSFHYQNNEVFIQRMTDSDYVMEQFMTAKRILEEENPGSDLLIVSWKDRLNDVDILNDTEFAGARIIRNALLGYGSYSSLPLDYSLDLMFDETQYSRVFNGLPGIMTLDGIQKPSFYALRFLDRQDKYLAGIGKNYMISASENKGYYQIVCHNCKKLGYRYYLSDHLFEDVDSFEDLFDDNDTLTICFRFHRLPAGEYLLKTRTISSKEGCAYHSFRKLKYSDDSYLGRDELAYIRASSIPEMKGESFTVNSDGEHEIKLTLSANEFRHLHIIRKRN